MTISNMDHLDKESRSELMRKIRSRDTKPERTVRSLLHRLGYRFRLHRADLPGTPDLVFPSRRKVIFVNGCYWHRHRCRKGRSMPATRRSFYEAKFARNKERDRAARRALNRLEWAVLTIWECELRDLEAVVAKCVDFLDDA